MKSNQSIMKGDEIVNKIHNMPMFFYPELEYYCFKNCYIQMLRYYGVKNPEFYIDCTTEWMFRVNKKSSFGYEFSTGDPYAGFITLYKNQVNTADCNNFSVDQLRKCNRESVRQGNPIIIAADVFYLNYTPFYHKKNSFHSLILSDWKEGKKGEDIWTIVDWYPPWFYRGTINSCELEEARSSENIGDGILSGYPINYMYSQVNRSGWKQDVKFLIELQIQQQLDSFYCKSIPGVYKGFNAIKQVFLLTEEYLENNLDERSVFFEDLYQKCFFVPNRKKLFVWFLNRAADYCEKVKYQKAIVAYNESMLAWKNFLSLLLKSTMVYNVQIYEQLCKQIELILEKEKNCYYTTYELSKLI